MPLLGPIHWHILRSILYLLRSGIFGLRWGEILLISSSTLPGLGRVSAKNVNKLTDFNAAVSSPGHNRRLQGCYEITVPPLDVRPHVFHPSLGKVSR